MSTSSSLDDTPGTRAEHAPTKGPNSGASHSKAAFSGISEVEAQAVDPESLIKLTSSEGEEFAVPYKVISKSILVKNLIEDLGVASDEPIPLPNVDSATFRKVLEWCTKSVDESDPLEIENEDEFLTTGSVTTYDWQRKFYDVEHDILFDIILAANYLDIKSLSDVGCVMVADLLRGKTAQEIRDMFQIENDFTPEEEEAIRRENEWAE